ncbi:MAG: YcaO-like family protein, partial [Desulfobulbaceae bacterium]|nr:YcaO-like family protein [Desulfobulbaceae bacterium]
ALIRALTEVAQLAGDFNSKANYVASGLPKPLSMDEVRYLTETEMAPLDSMPNLGDDNMLVEIQNCLAALQKIDMEVLVVNTMHDQLQVPTIYTIVPGAHFRERSMIKNVGLFAAKLVAERITDPEEAWQRLTAMQEILPNAYYLEFYLGKNLLDQERYEEAYTHLEHALTLNPEEEDIPYIYSYMGNCLKDIGKYDEAIAVLHKGTALDDERPDLHNMLGFCHFKKENYETAIDHFNRAVELHPASAIDHANLGVNYSRVGKNEEAINAFRIALSMDPTMDFAREHLTKLTAEVS